MITLITPKPKPRMTQADKWKRRPCVERYWQYKDDIRKTQILTIKQPWSIHFVMPMPKSWSKKKKREFNRTHHQQKPDIDNLIKALFDASYQDDSHIHTVLATKTWGYRGLIQIEHMPIELDFTEIDQFLEERHEAA